MICVSCRACIVFRKLVDRGDDDSAIRTVKDRMRAAALQAASDLRDDGYAIELDVDYLVAYEASGDA